MSLNINLKPYFQLLRIKDARGCFLIAFLGFLLAHGFLFPPKDIVLFFGIVFFLIGFGFSINDCFDLKEDKLDETKNNPIVSGKITFRKALFFSLFLAETGLILSALFGLKVFLFCLLAFLISFSYSAPPLRLKSRVFFDLLSHGLFYPLIFAIPLLIFKLKITVFHYLIFLSLFYFSVILDLRNQWEEFESDKKAGLKNTFNVLGYENSEKLLKYLTIFYPLIIFPIFRLLPWQYLFLFLLFTSVFLLLFLFAENHKLVRNYKILDIYISLALILILLLSF